jgi:2-methylcitrate dehydratase PrpD
MAQRSTSTEAPPVASSAATRGQGSISRGHAVWIAGLRVEDIPEDVLVATEARILDVIGLGLAGRRWELGAVLVEGAMKLGGHPEAHVIGDPLPTGAATAALANGALAEVIEFDDTHTESIVHVGPSVVSAALAEAERCDADGRDLIAAVAGGAEITCRLGVIAPGVLHPRGFHPTGILAPFGAVYAAGRVAGASAEVMTRAAGIVGSQAAGLLECWSDDTRAKAIHPGWAAHSALAALNWAQAGLTGPARVVEGSSGLFVSHVQNPSEPFDFLRASSDLGGRWESRGISFKPYPAAHVLHGLIEAALSIAGELEIEGVEEVLCKVAPHWAPIVCEPEAQKRCPDSPEAARISLHHAIAEALVYGRLDASSFSSASLSDPAVAALRLRIRHVVDPELSDRARLPGVLEVRFRSGGARRAEVSSNLGGAERPMSFEAVVDKFHANASPVLDGDAAGRVVAAVRALRDGGGARRIAAAWTGEAGA